MILLKLLNIDEERQDRAKKIILALVLLIGLPSLIWGIASSIRSYTWNIGDDTARQEEFVNEQLQALVDRGRWLLEKLPDLPPIPFDPNKDWGTSTSKLMKLNMNLKGDGKGGDSGSDNFIPGLVVVDDMKIDSKAMGGPNIQAKIHNYGTQPLENARVDILFLNGSGKVLLRRAINPLVISGGLFGDKIKPLYPGEDRAFHAAISHPPGWMGRLGVEVISYRFVQ